MYRIDDPSASSTLPTPEAANTEGYWTEGNPGSGIPATLERASRFNMIQEELRAIVIAAGLTPSKTTYNQVLSAIKALTPGRLLRVSVFTNVGGVQFVSINGGAVTTVGATAFTALAATSSVRVKVQGAGGGGGGSAATSTSQVTLASGGSAGSYAEGFFTAGFAGGLAVTVGAAGAGGAAGNNGGTTGNSSSVGSLISAPGGPGGAGSGVVANSTVSSNASPGRSALPSGGNVVSTVGQGGGIGIFLAGTTTPISGSGGSSPLGTGGNSATGSAGNVATGYGAGGSGASSNGSSAALAGGAASAGVVIVEEFA